MNHAFEADVLTKDREVFRVEPGIFSRRTLPPHRYSLPLEAPRPLFPRVKSGSAPTSLGSNACAFWEYEEAFNESKSL